MDLARTDGVRGRFSQDSLASARALPNTPIASSIDAGWTALLLEHHCSRGASAPFTTLATPDQTIVIATRGRHDIEVLTPAGWRMATYRPGSGGMTPAGASAQLRWRSRDKADAFATAHLYLPPAYFEDAAEHYRRIGQARRGAPLNALAFEDPVVAQTVGTLLEAMAAGAPDLYAQAAAQWLATHILARHLDVVDLARDRRAAGALSDRRLARVLDYLGAHFADPLTLDALAAEAAISKFHFVRLFRAKTGKTPHAYLFGLRIAAARRLLATSALPVADVARACGFASAAHFCTAFARAAGATPTAFRQAAHGQPANRTVE